MIIVQDVEIQKMKARLVSIVSLVYSCNELQASLDVRVQWGCLG